MALRSCTLFAILLFQPLAAGAQSVRIGVLGLFHPQELSLRAGRAEALEVVVGDQRFVLEPGNPKDIVQVRDGSDDQLVAEWRGRQFYGKQLNAAALNGSSASMILAVPRRLTRSYRGTLAMKGSRGELMAIVTMDLETAVASAVLAESLPGTAMEALKAQAVVARSYYVAGGGRHQGYDFCDLTHCQFLREPPAPGSGAARASRETQGLVLSYDETTIATMFTESCGGRTRTPAELGLPTGPYPYFAVLCDICHRHPILWSRRVSLEDAALLGKGEAGRLLVARRFGWTAIPSDNFTTRREGGQVLVEGKGHGHGIGLCQRGARAMAESGATFRDILAHYFPNAKLAVAEPRSR